MRDHRRDRPARSARRRGRDDSAADGKRIAQHAVDALPGGEHLRTIELADQPRPTRRESCASSSRRRDRSDRCPSRRIRSIRSACATMPAPRPDSSLSTRSKTSTSQPARRSSERRQAARSSSRRSPGRAVWPLCAKARSRGFPSGKSCYISGQTWRNAMAMTMLDKKAERSENKRLAGGHRRRIRAREEEPQSVRRQRAGVGDRTRAGVDHPPRSPASASASTATCSTISGPR